LELDSSAYYHFVPARYFIFDVRNGVQWASSYNRRACACELLLDFGQLSGFDESTVQFVRDCGGYTTWTENDEVSACREARQPEVAPEKRIS